MGELFKAIFDYGVTVVITGVCIWGVYKAVKALTTAIPSFFSQFIDQMKEMNSHYAKQNENMHISLGTINTSLEIIKKQGEENYTFFKEHDIRAEAISEKLTRIETKMDKCPK